MAEETKTTEVPKETVPVVAEPVVAEPVVPVEPAVASEPAAATTEASTAEPVAESTETPAAATEEAKKEEVTPIEEGILEAKGSSFPKNFIYSKKYFWFGADAVEPKHMNAYMRGEKVGEVAQHVAAWASHTGKGLLFYNEKPNDKSTPHGAIQLAEASEPAVDGTHKFHLTSKGHKHTFKAATPAERDNWVAQIKAKIAEAKELATTVTESETYKATLESFKPAPPAKKEEKKAEEPVKEETPKDVVAAEESKPEEPAKEAGRLEEPAKEEPKRRSASRKRGSIFGSLMGKKEESKEVKEAKKEEKPAESSVAEEAKPETAAPVSEPVASTEAAPVTETPVETAPVEAPVEASAAETKAPETKPAPAKRASIFGNLSFGKKKIEAEAAPAPPAKDTPVEAAAVSQNAPVIPAVETTEPLSAEVASPANVPVETVDATPATNGETKKEMKSEKRKSSLPFGFGAKKEKSASSDEEGEKPKSPFSKFRATINRKGKAVEKPAEKAEDKPAEAEASKEAEPAVESEAPKPVEAESEVPKPVETEETPAADKPLAATPQVAATA